MLCRDRAIHTDVGVAVVDAAAIQRLAAHADDGDFRRDGDAEPIHQIVLRIAKDAQREGEFLRVLADGVRVLARIGVHQPEPDALFRERVIQAADLGRVAIGNGTVGGRENERVGADGRRGGKRIDRTALEVNDAQFGPGDGGRREQENRRRQADKTHRAIIMQADRSMKRPKAVGQTPAGFRTSALIIFAIALIVRLLHVWQMRDTLFFSVLMGDSRGYDTWARQLAAGDWLGTEVFYQAPLYPYVLGVIYALIGRDLLAVRLIKAVLGGVSSVALGYAGWRLVSPAAGLVAGLMLALYPPAIFFDGLVQKSVLDVLFVCLALAIAGAIVATGGRPRAWLLLGVVMGALSLTRENALALVAVVLVWAASPCPAVPRWTLAALGRRRRGARDRAAAGGGA